MPIHYFTENVENPIQDEEKLSNWIISTITSESCQHGDINYIFCNDSHLLEINKEHLEHNYFTDIITFNLSDNKNIISGDLFISVDRVASNALELNISSETELKRVILHGILHLIGYNDKTESEKREIRKKEDFYLEKY
ncbi:MAG: rRNA maturation RNase YbeY [Bacteroidetes bacterium]|nr:MAG: rRNA maturation RNase YbeY [Bacteroidota bacterium]